MPIFTIRYTEMQERMWEIDVEADSQKEAERIFDENYEDPWRMVGDKKSSWTSGSSEDGEATDVYETNWEIEETIKETK